jgi:hypothetical protein
MLPRVLHALQTYSCWSSALSFSNIVLAVCSLETPLCVTVGKGRRSNLNVHGHVGA